MRKFLVFGAMAFSLGMGFQSALFSANSLLLHRTGGPAALFPVYLASALSTLAIVGIFYFFSDRYPRQRLYAASSTLVGTAVLGFWLWLKFSAPPAWSYLALRALIYAAYVLSSLQFWVLASEYFNNFQAKRRFPLLVAAILLGGMTGGALINLFAQDFGSMNLILIFVLVLFLLPVFFWSAGLQQEGARGEASESAEPIPSAGTNVAKDAAGKGVMVLLFLFWVSYAFICYGTDFTFNSIATQALPTEDALTAYYGKVILCVNFAVLVYQLLLAKPLSLMLGVDRSIMAVAVTVAGVWLWGYWNPSLTALSLVWGLVVIFTDFAVVSLMSPIYSVFPAGRRGRIKIFSEGLGRSTGILALFFLGLAFSFQISVPAMGRIMVGACLLLLIFPLVFRKAYLGHLLSCLGSRNLNLVGNAVQALGEKNKKPAMSPLLDLLEKTSSLDLKRHIILTLGQIQSREAIQEIASQFSIRNESLQVAVLESLGHFRDYESMFALFRLLKSKEMVSFQVRLNATAVLTRLIGKKMVPYLMEALQDPDPRVVANAVESIGLLRDPAAVELLRHYLDHPHHRIRANVAIALYPFRAMRPQVSRSLEKLCRSPDRHAFLAGLYAIGTLRLAGYTPDLLELLKSEDSDVRLQAAMALAKMKNPAFLDAFLALLLDESEKTAVEAARRMGEFPGISRGRVFERIVALPEAQRVKILARLDETPLDFSEEKNLLRQRGLMPAELHLGGSTV